MNNCLAKFYVSAKKQDGTFYSKKSLISIRAALERHLRSPPRNRPFSIVGDSAFSSANKTLNNLLKTLSKSGQIAPTVHKRPLTKDHIEKLYEEGEMVNCDNQNPTKLQQTAWFYISLFLGNRGRENQHAMKKYMMTARETPTGEKYYELCRERPGAVLATKNAQGGLNDTEDCSDGKIFQKSNSKHCPYTTVFNYLSHLNPECSNLFQKPRSLGTKKSNPAKDPTWFCASPLGHISLENMLRGMTTRAGIEPHLTKHCLRATTLTVLSANNFHDRHITKLTGHKSIESVRSYADRPTFEQFRSMANELANFIDDSAQTNPADGAAIIQVPVAQPPVPAPVIQNLVPAAPMMLVPAGNSASGAGGNNSNIFQVQDGQHLLNGLIPGGTFNNCSFQFNINIPGPSGGQ